MPTDLESHKHRVQLRSLTRAEQVLCAHIQLDQVEDGARVHLARALAHVREVKHAHVRGVLPRSVPQLLGDLETGDTLLEKIKRLCAERSRGITH